MIRYIIHLAYKGTHYHGWQYQPNAPTVQETLNKAFFTILRQEVNLTGCGRTDTGVHASQFYAHVDLNSEISDLEKFVYKINCILPEDIVIYSIHKAENDFHARFNAISRTYKYQIARTKNIFNADYCWQLYSDIDLNRMNSATEVLFRHIDFTSFSKLHTDVKTNNCKITHAKWTIEKDLLIFTITADRFLRNMVRSIVGTLIEVGIGKLSVEGFNEVIEKKDRNAAGPSVPAKGLFLYEILYPHQIL